MPEFILKIIEWVIFAGGIGYTIGSILQKRFAWLCLICYAPLLIFVSLYDKIYANAILYVYFFIQAVVAYRKWGNKDSSAPVLKPSFADNKKRAIVAGISFVIFVIIYTFFIKYTKNTNPFLDSIVFVMKVASMYFMPFKNIEGIFLMGSGNLLSALMFLVNGRFIASPMYLFSFAFNTYGLFTWYKQIKNDK
ncbi:MAG: hypothetical protein Ta2D_05170 [Rickettsiales bacterium]|nr:MAG: hypothetical protein Ta2D_05170 [Rickettsiales bacterium]